jgi:hypothetical protein
MSKFDQFKGGLPQVGKTGVPATGDRNPLVAAAAADVRKQQPLQQKAVVRRKARFAIALDATGSMAGLLANAKASLSEIIRRISREAGLPVEIQLFVYRDYDCGPDVLEISAPTTEADELIAWLSRIRPMGGGGNEGEAIEVALEKILEAEHFNAAMIAGDEPPNGQATLSLARGAQTRSAQQLARLLGENNTPVHTFVVGARPTTITAFKEIARSSGGQSGRLDGSDAMIDMAVLAMLAALKGASGVRDYVNRTQLSSSGKAFATLLLSGPSR